MLHTSPSREESRVDQEGKDGQQQQSGGLWAAGIFFVALVFLLIVLGGYVQEWEWTGLAIDTNYPKRTLWDWLDLLIVPAVLAIGGYLFTRSERTLDREIADERRQDDTLQAYLDGMSQLLTDKERALHRAQSGDSLSTVARARTLTVLGRLDSSRKGSVLQFLFESRLIYRARPPHLRPRLRFPLNASVNASSLDWIEEQHNIVSLYGANLIGTNLSGAILIDADLSETNLSRSNLSRADLTVANLSGGNLSEADLSGGNLSGADLSGGNLSGANLSRAEVSTANLTGADLGGAILIAANLSGANLIAANLSGTDLGEADLIMAYLSHADLTGADLSGADLSGADLTNAKVTTEQLREAKSLEGATMPNGQKYEDWLQSREEGDSGS
jgi:uncharacterized protein YjbI with pentapeptide repeats